MTKPNGDSPPESALSDVVDTLNLAQLDESSFSGRAVDPGWGQLYGGHVYAQALAAAQRTVPGDRPVNVHQGTFLLTGDVNEPITYDVELTRDGRSFSSRRVTARQRGELIFHAATSFQLAEPGLEHQDPMPDVPPPESVPSEDEIFEALAPRLSPARRERLAAMPKLAFDLHPMPGLDDPDHPQVRPARRDVWLRARGQLPADPALQACLLAYVSDYHLLSTALLPHGESWISPRVQLATLNHTLWFHAPFRVDTWLLHSMHSPRAAHASGLSQGAFYSRDGVLVATSAQEGLMRRRQKPQRSS